MEIFGFILYNFGSKLINYEDIDYWTEVRSILDYYAQLFFSKIVKTFINREHFTPHVYRRYLSYQFDKNIQLSTLSPHDKFNTNWSSRKTFLTFFPQIWFRFCCYAFSRSISFRAWFPRFWAGNKGRDDDEFLGWSIYLFDMCPNTFFSKIF